MILKLPSLWLAVVNNAVIVALSATLSAATIKSYLPSVAHDLSELPGLLFILPFPLAIGILAFVAAFRQNCKAASILAKICLVLFFLSIFSYFVNVFLWLISGKISADVSIWVIVGCGFVTVYLLFCWWINRVLEKFLRAAAKLD